VRRLQALVLQVRAPLLLVPVPVLAPVQALLAPVPVLLDLDPNPPMGRRQEPKGPNCQSKTLTSQN
jgi:hypothetical protein